MKKGIFLFIVLIFVCRNLIHGQLSNSPNVSIIPPSPTASALGKYADVPVSLSTGIPQISVPVYTIQSNGLQVPVSLSYHAGGIKVEDIAS